MRGRLLEKANKHKEKYIQETKEKLDYIMENCPTSNSDNFYNKCYQNALKIDYQIMPFEQYIQLKRNRYLSDDLKEITEKQWNNALDALPPLCWCTIDGVNEFCMSEMYDASFTTQYAKYNGKYYCKMVDSLDKSTWIHNYKNKMK